MDGDSPNADLEMIEHDDMVEVWKRGAVSSGEPSLDGSMDEERAALSDSDLRAVALTQVSETGIEIAIVFSTSQSHGAILDENCCRRSRNKPKGHRVTRWKCNARPNTTIASDKARRARRTTGRT